MSDVDEDDKFLYGSDEDQLEPTSPIVVTNEKKRNNEDLNITQDNINNKKQKIDTVDSKLTGNNESDMEEGESDDSDDESDWDIEIIVSKGKDPTRLDSDSITASSATTPGSITSAIVPASTTSTAGSISIATESTKESESGKSTKSGEEEENELEEQAKASIDMAPGSLDIDKDGLYDGEPVTKIDPEVLKEKPWRRPGADISDYFNYGFNEYTWMEYLDRQEKWREEYNPRKILMGLLSLQQQGKLDPTPGKTNQSTIPNIPDMNRNNNAPPQMMSPFPMFGGFPPFMPGMMPNMNPQQMQNQNNLNKPPQQGSSSQSPPQQMNKK